MRVVVFIYFLPSHKSLPGILSKMFTWEVLLHWYKIMSMHCCACVTFLVEICTYICIYMLHVTCKLTWNLTDISVVEAMQFGIY